MAGGGNWSSDLLKREEEYKRLNAELESKTANLVREAESVLRRNDDVLSKSSHKKGTLLDNVNTDEIAIDSDEDIDVQFNSSQSKSATSSRARPSKIPCSAAKQRTSSAASGGGGKSKPPTSSRSQAAASARGNAASGAASGGRSRRERDDSYNDGNEEEADEPVPAFVTEFQRDLAGRVAELEEEVHPDDEPAEDVLPMAAQDMGPEAQMRFLKAKVRVSEEESARLQAEVHKLHEETRKLSQRAKDAEEERAKALRSAQTLQTQLEKYRKASEEAASRADGLEKQLAGLRRDVDQMKRQEKQQSAGTQAAEVRLNRALEEAEKYKAELAKARAAKKDAGEGEKKRADALLQENKKLERQKNELIAGFRKQMKLVDILKRQRMHLEAAKMLQFTEEEFVKALDWEKG